MAIAASATARPEGPVIRWLLDSDPSIRWQVQRDLVGAPAAVVAAERSRVAVEGWGARLLGLQQPDGNWGGGPWAPGSWASTMETLMLLRDLGLDPASPPARQAIARVREGSDWGPWHGHSPFFDGETEPCINGRVLACGAYFGEASDRLVDRLLGEQLPDGGWNCDAPPSSRSSFNTTVCVLEGLLEYQAATGVTGVVEEARRRGQEYLLERKLCRSLSSGHVIDRDRKSGCDWRAFAFPTRWHYDVLWGLDYLRRAGADPDVRAAEAVDRVAAKRRRSGRWPLDVRHAGRVHFSMERAGGRASRGSHSGRFGVPTGIRRRVDGLAHRSRALARCRWRGPRWALSFLAVRKPHREFAAPRSVPSLLASMVPPCISTSPAREGQADAQAAALAC